MVSCCYIALSFEIKHQSADKHFASLTNILIKIVILTFIFIQQAQFQQRITT